MAKCEVCSSDYHFSFEVITAGGSHTFDCFECAIHKLAPACASCGCRIIGHGVEADDEYFCCANCAKTKGVEGLVAHAPDTEIESTRIGAPTPGSMGGHFS